MCEYFAYGPFLQGYHLLVFFIKKKKISLPGNTLVFEQALFIYLHTLILENNLSLVSRLTGQSSTLILSHELDRPLV